MGYNVVRDIIGLQEVVRLMMVQQYLVASMHNLQRFTTPAYSQRHSSVKRDIVISKIYAAGSKDNNNKRYVAGQYIDFTINLTIL